MFILFVIVLKISFKFHFILAVLSDTRWKIQEHLMVINQLMFILFVIVLKISFKFHFILAVLSDTLWKIQENWMVIN